MSPEERRKHARMVAAEKVRAQGLQCVLNMARFAPKLFHQHWSPLLPSDAQAALSSRPFAGPSLLTVALHDPSPKVRALAAACLTAALPDSPLSRWSGGVGTVDADARGATAQSAIAKKKTLESKDKSQSHSKLSAE